MLPGVQNNPGWGGPFSRHPSPRLVRYTDGGTSAPVIAPEKAPSHGLKPAKVQVTVESAMPAFSPKLFVKVPEAPVKVTDLVTMRDPSANQVMLPSLGVDTIVDGSVTPFVHDKVVTPNQSTVTNPLPPGVPASASPTSGPAKARRRYRGGCDDPSDIQHVPSDAD